jgi:hypothetical protein
VPIGGADVRVAAVVGLAHERGRTRHRGLYVAVAAVADPVAVAVALVRVRRGRAVVAGRCAAAPSLCPLGFVCSVQIFWCLPNTSGRSNCFLQKAALSETRS